MSDKANDWASGYDAAVQEYEPMLRECEETEDALVKILKDLIEDIVGEDGEGHEITEGDYDDCLVCKAVSQAEARLREVQSE